LIKKLLDKKLLSLQQNPPMTIQDINRTIEPQKKGVATAFLVCKSKNN
jgi:hypothetical protein